MSRPKPKVTGNNWDKWGNHVLEELERLNKCNEKMDKRLEQSFERLGIIQIQIAEMKVQTNRAAKIWGFVGGMIPVAVVFILWLLRGGV